MIARLCIWLLVLFLAFPVTAQEFDYDESGRMIPEGTRGRYTQEQMQVIALGRIPGEILDHSIWRDNDDVYHAITIESRDTSVYKIHINAVSARIFDVEINYLAPGVTDLAMNIVSRDQAEILAVHHVKENTMGKRNPKALSSVLAIERKEPVYKVTVKKSARKYVVVIDAESGDIIQTDEL